ncbi:MAG: DUF1295 domain-containing protein [Planctomycetota bacterium]
MIPLLDSWTLQTLDWTSPLLSLLVVSPLMALLWLVQRRTGDAGIVDVAWAAGLGSAGILAAWTGDGETIRRMIVGGMAGVWGFRLAGHLLTDRILGDHGEDGRYRALREEWGDGFQRRLFWFYQGQAILVAVLAIPFAVACARRGGVPDVFDLVGVTLWGISILGESIADRQLAAFRSNPANRGKTCRSGLWRYSRHPNYFFEWIHWWAYAVIALPGPSGWIALFAPALMLFFMLKVTGIPPTEAQALKSRGDDYREYQRTTSAFIPWFPRKRAS